MAHRSTLDSSKAMKMGFGILEGKVLVTGARVKTIQRSGAKGLSTPFTALQFDCTKVNDKLERLDENAPPETTELLIGWGSKIEKLRDGDAGKHRFFLVPGVYEGDPAKPETQVKTLGNAESVDEDGLVTCDIDVEGDTFCSEKPGVPYADADAAIFMKSLEKAGWKAEINGQNWAGNYVGLIMEIKTVNKEDLCKELGISYRAQEVKAGGTPPTIWKVVQIYVRPYEKGAGKAKGAGKGSTAAAGAAASKANGSAASTTAAEAGTNGEAGTGALNAFFAEYAKTKGGQTLARKDFQKEIGMFLMGKKAKMPDVQAFVAENIQSNDGLVGFSLAEGFTVNSDDKGVPVSVTF